MTEGFFSPSQLSSAKSQSITPRCGLCGLSRGCLAPKMKPTGKCEKDILFVAEAPGEKEDAYIDPITGQRGKQLIGRAGQYLRQELKTLHISLDRDCVKTNACICRPKNNTTPTDKMISACRPNLLKTIKQYKPKVIVLLGNTAVESFIPTVWKEDVGGLGRWLGWNIPCQKYNAWVCPTYHPSYMIRTNNDLLQLFFWNHLKAAIRHKDRPWEKIPNYKDEVEIILKSSKAAKAIRSLPTDKPTVVDFETNCLKPEEEGSEIVSCSMYCQGRTISYLWEGDAVEATAEVLKSPRPKIAGNMKFEDRWTRNKLGFPVNNWMWDTVLAAHVLDNRPGITSVKFQAFALLGLEAYNEHIEPLLKPEGDKRFNRIREIPLMQLLLYGGLDSLVEYKIAKIQMKQAKRMKK